MEEIIPVDETVIVDNIEVGKNFVIEHKMNELFEVQMNIKKKRCKYCKEVYFYTRKEVCGFCGKSNQ